MYKNRYVNEQKITIMFPPPSAAGHIIGILLIMLIFSHKLNSYMRFFIGRKGEKLILYTEGKN